MSQSHVDSKTAPDGDMSGFVKRRSRQGLKRKYNKTRDGQKAKKKATQSRKKARRQKQKMQDVFVPPEDNVEMAPNMPMPGPQDPLFLIYDHINTGNFRCDYDVFAEALTNLGWHEFDQNSEQQRRELLDAIRRVETQRILGDDEDTKHTEIKDSLGSPSAMDTSADISMNLSQSPLVEMTDTSELIDTTVDPTPSTEMILTDDNDNSELKEDILSQPTPTTQPPQRVTPIVEEEPVVVPDTAVVHQDTVVVTRRDDENRSKGSKKRKRRRGKRNKASSEMSPPTEEQVVAPTANGGTSADLEERQVLSEEPEEVDELPVMNGGHVEEDNEDEEVDEPDFEVVESMPRQQMTEEELLDQEVNAFDCTQHESRALLQTWIDRLQNDYDKSFAQMFYSIDGVEKVVRSVLLDPQKCVCDTEIIKLFDETLLGPRDYHAYLFQEMKRLAAQLARRHSIRDEILPRIEEIISAQKHQPESSAPEIEKQVFDVPSKHWAKNASCPSFDMWEKVDSKAANLQEKHNQLREGKIHTRLKQPNKNPQVLHSLTLVAKLAQDGTARLAQREMSERTTLTQLEQERAKINDLKRNKIQPLQTQLDTIRQEYQHYVAQKRKLERELSQLTLRISNMEREEQELQKKIDRENDFGMQEQVLSRKIDERKFELAIIQNESKCYSDLRAITFDIHHRLDAWSNQQISDQQELHDGLAQSYLNQLISFIDSYTKILQFFSNRVTFARELISKRQAEQKEAARLYGREKSVAYDDEISRYKRQEEADQKTADLIRLNMYSYIEAAQEVVRDSRFQEFIYLLHDRVGKQLDVTKYAKTESRRMLNSGVENRRREVGSQTGSREYPSRSPKSSTNASVTHDLSLPPRGRGGVPVIQRGRSGYSQSQPTNRVNSMPTSGGVPTGRQPIPADQSQSVRGGAPSVLPSIFPQFPPQTFPIVSRMVPPHQQTMTANLTMAPPMQGRMEMEQRARRHHGPIVTASGRRQPRFDR